MIFALCERERAAAEAAPSVFARSEKSVERFFVDFDRIYQNQKEKRATLKKKDKG